MSRAGITAAVVALMVGLLWWVAMPGPMQDSAPAVAGSGAPEATSGNRLQPTPAAGRQSAPVAVEPSKPVTLKPAPTTEPASAAPAEPAPANTPMAPPRLDGPVAERKQRFETEPRDSGAAQYDALVQTAFHDDVSSQLLKAVLCRESICKLELRWSSDRNTGYMLALTRLLPRFDHELAVAPTGDLDADGVLPMEVYLKRLPVPATP